jgi:hypothetical protein
MCPNEPRDDDLLWVAADTYTDKIICDRQSAKCVKK